MGLPNIWGDLIVEEGIELDRVGTDIEDVPDVEYMASNPNRMTAMKKAEATISNSCVATGNDDNNTRWEWKLGVGEEETGTGGILTEESS